MAVIIPTHPVITYAFLHLANVIIISDLSSLTSPFGSCLGCTYSVRLTITSEISPAPIRDLGNILSTAPLHKGIC